jgi:IS1 family transposase
VAWALVKERNYHTMQPVIDAVFEKVPQVKRFYSDSLSAYELLVYRGLASKANHHAMKDKSQTYSVEGVNADLRCYVPSLDRRGRCFARCWQALNRLLSLFITAYNRCCLFRIQHPNRIVHPTIFYRLSFSHSVCVVFLSLWQYNLGSNKRLQCIYIIAACLVLST